MFDFLFSSFLCYSFTLPFCFRFFVIFCFVSHLFHLFQPFYISRFTHSLLICFSFCSVVFLRTLFSSISLYSVLPLSLYAILIYFSSFIFYSSFLFRFLSHSSLYIPFSFSVFLPSFILQSVLLLNSCICSVFFFFFLVYISLSSSFHYFILLFVFGCLEFVFSFIFLPFVLFAIFLF